jgi:hypothetical protein
MANSFAIPGWAESQRRAEGDQAAVRREWHGATYGIEEWSKGRHDRDPEHQIAHREPPGYQHPQHLGPDVLDPGGPRILPVKQRIEHGPHRDREEEF